MVIKTWKLKVKENFLSPFFELLDLGDLRKLLESKETGFRLFELLHDGDQRLVQGPGPL